MRPARSCGRPIPVRARCAAGRPPSRLCCRPCGRERRPPRPRAARTVLPARDAVEIRMLPANALLVDGMLAATSVHLRKVTAVAAAAAAAAERRRQEWHAGSSSGWAQGGRRVFAWARTADPEIVPETSGLPPAGTPEDLASRDAFWSGLPPPLGGRLAHPPPRPPPDAPAAAHRTGRRCVARRAAVPA